jgi:hypothetical protein
MMGVIMVFFVSLGYIYLINRQIRYIQAQDVGMVAIFSVLISVSYLAMVRRIVLGGWRDKVAYVIGACIGSVCAMLK